MKMEFKQRLQHAINLLNQSKETADGTIDPESPQPKESLYRIIETVEIKDNEGNVLGVEPNPSFIKLPLPTKLKYEMALSRLLFATAYTALGFKLLLFNHYGARNKLIKTGIFFAMYGLAEPLILLSATAPVFIDQEITLYQLQGLKNLKIKKLIEKQKMAKSEQSTKIDELEGLKEQLKGQSQEN